MKYFHCQAKKRRSYNHIKALKFTDGSWCYDEELIKNEVLNFFRQLYTSNDKMVGHFAVKNLFPFFNAGLRAALARSVSF